MTKNELKKYKEILMARQAELELFVRNREGIAIEKSPDALDEVQHAAERELAIRIWIVNRNCCATCAAHCAVSTKAPSECVCIAKKTSAPSVWPRSWTPFCIQCQETADRNQADGSESFDDLMVNAA